MADATNKRWKMSKDWKKTLFVTQLIIRQCGYNHKLSNWNISSLWILENKCGYSLFSGKSWIFVYHILPFRCGEQVIVLFTGKTFPINVFRLEVTMYTWFIHYRFHPGRCLRGFVSLWILCFLFAIRFLITIAIQDTFWFLFKSCLIHYQCIVGTLKNDNKINQKHILPIILLLNISILLRPQANCVVLLEYVL